MYALLLAMATVTLDLSLNWHFTGASHPRRQPLVGVQGKRPSLLVLPSFSRCALLAPWPERITQASCRSRLSPTARWWCGEQPR
ncbi:hypothetical protein B0H21DRAFT_754829 [Amylocystis lapponica]|nr:hypothetical protein B0H21DRAFT_754829 [Amylocystis lapponica]